ncbi:EF-hand domain-containing protein [Pseudoalteromonas sp. SWYJ118]|nr:EF-hand domain-containing protein [Pseudoalteromonas sp. SWYJZ19]MBH0076494.1 EF-hand domain-containing protein [Pseudoalteromonas sp. SWYJ118]
MRCLKTKHTAANSPTKDQHALPLAALASSSAVDFGSFDTDGDGVISKSEAQVNSQLVQLFDQLDADGNGELSKEEFSKVQ